MIKVFSNGDIARNVVITKFFDNTKKIKLDNIVNPVIHWFYESDDELSTIIFIAKHLQDQGKSVELHLPYIPNARMDRVSSDNEVFTLKHFCDTINWLNFSKVIVRDPHSFVAPALIHRCVQEDIITYINKAIELSGAEVLIYPDFGAFKRYHTFNHFGFPELYGRKIRDWETREIIRYELTSDDNKSLDDVLKDKKVLIIDDIIATGETMLLAIQEIYRHGCEVSLYCTHLENTIFNKQQFGLYHALSQGLVDKIYTTESLFNSNHPSVVIL